MHENQSFLNKLHFRQQSQLPHCSVKILAALRSAIPDQHPEKRPIKDDLARKKQKRKKEKTGAKKEHC
jgi:hypothetical protein